MSFRMVPNSVTLDDLERRNSPNGLVTVGCRLSSSLLLEVLYYYSYNYNYYYYYYYYNHCYYNNKQQLLLQLLV